jgi:enterochelin esterase-like enzyme
MLLNGFKVRQGLIKEGEQGMKENRWLRTMLTCLLAAGSSVSLIACGSVGPAEGELSVSPGVKAINTKVNSAQEAARPQLQQQNETTPVPSSYFEEAEQQGRVVRIDYETYDYTNPGQPVTKPAFVYLPYGYDENDSVTKYNIFYMMHGWTGTANEFFELGNRMATNMLDSMIENGDMAPVIVVSPTFDTENSAQSFSRSVDEIAVFHNELISELIPAVEGRFHTFADTTDAPGLDASREHRAFGGFSLGAVTTWYTFVYNLNSFKYFLPMSGDCWILQQYGGRYQPQETSEYLENIVQESGYREKDFFIYAATGTDDAMFDQVDYQMQAMLKLTDIFTPDNLVYNLKPGGVHDYNAVTEYIYNALPVFFPGN